ncbi:Phosphotransferase enzyme family protein [Marinomonas spartinae]|uniref:phosphotransferase n=1 Tax=Marinomonas spartinae TaxID=1792290 RepID=UPI000808F48A|nr:phosphotransferase [Marinomonas spartinae]SBS39273.1 Phosphotransferase enzyme family protein [Marinomonas spartinae]
MPSHPLAIQENLYFLLNEVEKHYFLVDQFFKTQSPDVLPRIYARRGYMQTLREKIEIKCSEMTKRRKPGTAHAIRVEAVRSLAAALEGVAQHYLDCVQEGTLEQAYEHPGALICSKLLRRMDRSLNLVKVGLDKSQRRIGIKLGRSTQGLLAMYDDIQEATLAAKAGLTDTQLKSAILSNYALKCAIQQLAIVGESLIKADLGQVVSLQNYDHLRDSVSSLNYSLSDLKVRRLALTRSGSAIAAISHKDESGKDILAVYKEGDHNKLAEEVEGMKHWRDVDPQLAPDVLAHTTSNGRSSSLLIEHLPGKTLEALLIDPDKDNDKAFEVRKETVNSALSILFKTLNRIWKVTYTPEHCQARFMQQLAKRIDDSIRVHPDFFTPEHRICGQVRPSFAELMRKVGEKEAHWRVNFSVLIHGDFNVDNVIYDSVEKRIYFIDLHRSAYFDYVQDLSVLMVSIYRLQVLSGSTRELMMQSAMQIYQFGRRFAKRQNDDYFELRLAAGLARSFATSTRFIFDKKLASRMHLRARYLLEHLARITTEQELNFKLPIKELYVE